MFGLSGTIKDSHSESGKISLLYGEIPVDPIPKLMFCDVDDCHNVMQKSFAPEGPYIDINSKLSPLHHFGVME